MPYYEGQTGQTTRRARGGGRQSDLLMQQLGTSSSSEDASPSDDFAALGFDNNSTTSSAPLTFDASTDTRVGNPRKRRGNGSHLGNASAQREAQSRPRAAGMIRNDEEVARRQQIIQDVASSPSPRMYAAPTNAAAPAPANRVMPQNMAQVSRGRGASQQSGPIQGISLNDGNNDASDGEGLLRSNPLTERIRMMRGRKFINPVTFIRENGGGVETFGIWLYEYRHLFILLTILFLIIGMLFDRRISFGAGIVMILVGVWLDRIDDENDTFLLYICGIVTAFLPYLMPA